jgi:hypothetical protein
LFKGDSTLEETWKQVPNDLDVIIDDGSHHPDSQIETFTYGFSHLHIGGLYFIEDLHCNFEEKYTGGHDIIFKWLFDLIMNQQKAVGGDFPGNFHVTKNNMNDIAKQIYSYHFYKSVVCFEKA